LGSLDGVSPFSVASATNPPSLVLSPLTGVSSLHTHVTDNIIRVGLNYNF
jgi:hypothetical protein